MRKAILLATILFLTGLAGCIADNDSGGDDGTESGATEGGAGDAVVVAVLDFQFNPYHWDFLADHMPQHQDDNMGNDLPLDQAPHTWLPGFPEPSDAFASYTALNLTLTPDDPGADPSCAESDGNPPISSPTTCPDGPGLYQRDAEEWGKVQRSTTDETHFHYIPGTKVVGFVNHQDNDGFSPASHGGGSASVSTGNLFGTCPNCLLVFVNLGAGSEEWAREQDWIDVTTHSYESSTVPGGYTRDNRYDCDPSPMREAVERGQQIFWAAGNGYVNTFTAPQSTFVNCEKAPEWTATVGAISPDNESFSGHAKPVHVANLGISYPRAGGGNVTDESTFSGTSNATPVTAGMYAQALYELRTRFEGATRVQEGGVVATGEPGCGAVNGDCAMVDGELTVHELREAVFRASEHTEEGYTVGITPVGAPASSQEQEYLTEGHGSLHGTMGDLAEESQRIVDFVTGDWFEEVPQDLHDWMVAYSWCVQQAWGTWEHGYWKDGDSLPEPDPEWPYRNWMASDACPASATRNPA